MQLQVMLVKLSQGHILRPLTLICLEKGLSLPKACSLSDVSMETCQPIHSWIKVVKVYNFDIPKQGINTAATAPGQLTTAHPPIPHFITMSSQLSEKGPFTLCEATCLQHLVCFAMPAIPPRPHFSPWCNDVQCLMQKNNNIDIDPIQQRVVRKSQLCSSCPKQVRLLLHDHHHHHIIIYT